MGSYLDRGISVRPAMGNWVRVRVRPAMGNWNPGGLGLGLGPPWATGILEG